VCPVTIGDHTYLASTSGDETAEIWDLDLNSPVLEIEMPTIHPAIAAA
jgi:WD40 repeat protein